MSYEKKIENHYVNFVTEIDYLNCRIEYVRLHRDKNSGVSSITFLEFIQYELYDKDRCWVVSHFNADSYGKRSESR